mgnify:CR=1 FL=1
MTNQTAKVHNIFPTPVYIAKRDSDLIPREKKEIEKIIQEGMTRNEGNASSDNTYIFNGKLKKLKQFCNQQIKIYVEQVINPKEELDFYITQSWLNITKPGEFHHGHFHTNSIISGVFYISTEEDDNIAFADPNTQVKDFIVVGMREYNTWNSTNWFVPAITNELILFPSYLNHKVESNEKATTDRISISFNTFVRGNLGDRRALTELILK